MKNKNFLTGKKAIALLSALGVTATLLSPLALNTKILANDETLQIETRTTEDTSSYEIIDDFSINYNDYNGDDAAFINAILSYAGDDLYAHVYNVPEGYTLQLPKDTNISGLKVYVGGDKETYLYKIEISNYVDSNDSISNFSLKENAFYIPKLDEILNQDKDYVSQIVVGGTDFITINTQLFSDQLSNGDENVGRLWIREDVLEKYGYNDFYYRHVYNHKSGILSTSNVTIYNSQNCIRFNILENSSIFCANQFADGSTTRGIYANTFDATDSNSDQLLQTILEEGASTNNKLKMDTYDYTENATISSKVFELFQKYNLTYEIEVHSEIPYTLTFNEITEVKDLNTYMEFTKVTYGDELAFEFDFAHSGTLPGPMTVRMYVGPEYNTQTAYLYYKNSDGKLEKQASNAKVERGYAEFTITHCSTYVVSLNEIDSDYTVESTDATTPSTSTETESNTGTSTGSTTSTETSTDSSLENVNNSTASTTVGESTSTTTSTKEDTNIDLTNEDSPVTGDTTQTALLLFTMVLAGIILVGSIKILKKARYF